MIEQVEIALKPKSRGLSINENADPDVRVDMETIFNRLVPANRPEYEHTLEGADDMPAHAKSTLSGVSLTIPITNGHLNMGTWLLRIQELWWGKKTGSNNHRRVSYGIHRTFWTVG